MKPVIIATLVMLATPAWAQDPWVAHKPEVAAVDAAVRAPLEAYLRGHATGDAAQFRQAFHDDAEIWGVRGDTVIQWTDDEYIGRAGTGQPPADEAERRRWIEVIDVTGDTGAAKIVLDYPAVKFTDYMQLMRVDGRWLIINKMFLAEPRAAPAS